MAVEREVKLVAGTRAVEVEAEGKALPNVGRVEVVESPPVPNAGAAGEACALAVEPKAGVEPKVATGVVVVVPKAGVAVEVVGPKLNPEDFAGVSAAGAPNGDGAGVVPPVVD